MPQGHSDAGLGVVLPPPYFDGLIPSASAHIPIITPRRSSRRKLTVYSYRLYVVSAVTMPLSGIFTKVSEPMKAFMRRSMKRRAILVLIPYFDCAPSVTGLERHLSMEACQARLSGAGRTGSASISGPGK